MTAKIRELTPQKKQIPEVLSTAIHPSVLKKLLIKNGVSVPGGALAKSCDTFQPQGAVLKPAERLMGIDRKSVV